MHLGRNLADRALDLGVAGMADQDDLAALRGVATALVVHLRHQRTGGVDHRQVPLGGELLDPLGDAVGGEDGHRAGRDLVELIDEHRASGAQVLDHVAIMDDLVSHIDRRPYFFRARSTISIARSTPAQKPRGWARTTRIMGKSPTGAAAPKVQPSGPDMASHPPVSNVREQRQGGRMAQNRWLR